MGSVNDEVNKVLAAIQRGMEKAVIEFEADTKLLTHVDTGALRRSWTHKVNNDNGIINGVVGSNLLYAPIEDDYHGNLSVALEENKTHYLEVVANEIKNS